MLTNPLILHSYIKILFVKFAPSTSPVAIELYIVHKLNQPEIFGISWFAEFNPQIDWLNHSVSLGLDVEKHTIVSIYTANFFFWH